MNAVLDFPPLPVAEEPAEVAAEVVDAAPAGLVTLREHTMQPLSGVERGIADLRAEHGSTAYDIKTPAGYRLATLRRAAVRKVRYEVPKIVKAKKAELAGLREQVEEEGARIVELLREIEDPHDALIAAEDARKEAIKAEAARVEALRVEKHQANIALIRSFAEHAKQPGMTSARIADGMTALQAQTYPAETWEEFAVPAANAQCETLEAMRVLHAQAVAREAEAARQEAIRIENERQAEANRREAARIAAEADAIRRQAAELAAQRAESERLEALAAANRERLATEEQAKAGAALALAAALTAPADDVQSTPADPIRPDDPDAAPPMTAEEMSAEKVDRDDALAAMERDDLIHAAGARAMLAKAGEILSVTTDAADIEAGLSEDPPALVPNAIVPLLTIEAVNDWLSGPRVSIDFLAFMGIRPTLGSRYAETQFPAIKAALIAHLQGLK